MPISSSRHPYYSYASRRHKPKKRKSRLWLFLSLPILVVVLCTYWYIQPVDPISYKKKVLSTQVASNVLVSWPATSQASVGSIDEGVLASKPGQVSRPTASTAKIITVLTVLKHKPITSINNTPTITLTQSDVDIYNQYYAKDGSVAKVENGEKLTQYQMLQGILLPSANNYADSLAIWAFGSLENYQKAATEFVKEIGMKNTKIGSDASGFSPDTSSNTEDLTKLAIAAMKNEVVSNIVKQDHVDLPVAGTKQNTNWLLGADGVVGIKTGNTNEAGGVYIFASQYTPEKNYSTTIVGAVQGEPSIMSAIHQARILIDQVKPFFVKKKVVNEGQVIATYTSPWGVKINAIAKENLELLAWKDTEFKPSIYLEDVVAPVEKGEKVGTIKVGTHSVDIVLESALESPTWQWRVLRWL